MEHLTQCALQCSGSMHLPVPGSHRRPEEELDVAPARGVDGDDGLHVLQVVDLRVQPRASSRLDRQEQRLVRRDLPV